VCFDVTQVGVVGKFFFKVNVIPVWKGGKWVSKADLVVAW
jgi:hypothetical protein